MAAFFCVFSRYMYRSAACMIRLRSDSLVPVSLAVVGAVSIMGQIPRPKLSDEVWTKRLVIADQAGTKRMGLSMSKEGPALLMWDGAGKTQLSLATDKDGATLILKDAAGDARKAVAPREPVAKPAPKKATPARSKVNAKARVPAKAKAKAKAKARTRSGKGARAKRA